MKKQPIFPPFQNPFRPGAGHQPPYLAGRSTEKKEFERVLEQTTILQNVILTGLRGVGKTVLLETFKPLAVAKGWLWVGTDMSESTSISEEHLATRLLADLAVVTSGIVINTTQERTFGLSKDSKEVQQTLDFQTLVAIYQREPGLVSDKLKKVLGTVWHYVKGENKRGIIFAYDEAQTLADHASSSQFPLSLLLDVFQSVQKKDIPFMLVLTGLPTLFPKLVEARTFAERMFRVIFLDRLTDDHSQEAITKPVDDANCPARFTVMAVEKIVEYSGGYPYFIQYICREAYDALLQQIGTGQPAVGIPLQEIVRKLDSDFFAGRWARVTDRQRQLLGVIATLDGCDSEFTVQEIVEASKKQLDKPFGASQISQMLTTLADAGLVYRNRHGKYSFAVPMLKGFIERRKDSGEI